MRSAEELSGGAVWSGPRRKDSITVAVGIAVAVKVTIEGGDVKNPPQAR